MKNHKKGQVNYTMPKIYDLVIKSVHVKRVLNKSLTIKVKITNKNGLTYDLEYPYKTNFSDADWERSAHDETNRRWIALCNACGVDFNHLTDYHELIGRTVNGLDVDINN